MRAKRLTFVLMAAVAFLGGGNVGEAAIRVVAYSGQQAPGLTAGVEFDEFGDSFSTPRIDGQGRVAFAGSTRNPNLSLGPSGIWTERTGALALLVKQNDPAPGTSSTILGGFTTSLVMNKSGHSIFRSPLSGGNFGYFTDRTGVLTNIASEGLMTAFGPLTSFDGSSPMLIDDSGRTTFEAYVDGDTGVLLKEVAGGPAIVAVEGMDTLEDHRFKIFTGSSPFLPNAMTGVGHVLATTSLEGDAGNNTVWTQGLYRDSSGVFAAIQLNQTPAPGEAATFASMDDPAMNNAGQTVFESLLSGPSVIDATNHGIFYLTTGAPTRLMRDGTPAPGTAAGVNFSNALGEVNANPVINAAGKVLFQYGLTGPGVTTANDIGLWVGTPGNVSKLVREGDSAPGVGSGATFTSFGPERVINGAGQVAFYAFFNGPGGAGAGLFAQDTSGVIQLIARTGQTIQIAPGDVRTIETLDVHTGPTGNQDGRATFFNDQGHLAFRATFTDAEETDAILVSDGVASPFRAADFQEDHDVDNADLALWRTNFGATTGATHMQGDSDFDGDVDGRDFLVWQQQRGSGPLATVDSAAVPEPRSLGAICIAAFAYIAGSRSQSSTKDAAPKFST